MQTPPASQPPPRIRRALTNAGGAIHRQGPPLHALPLEEILSGLEHEPVDLLTHNFHTYPARLHPMLCRRVLERFARPGDHVLDPFCGGGTTVLEALVRGCRAIGTDINPIALRITKTRTLRWPDIQIDAFIAEAEAISDANFQDARRKVREPLGDAARAQAEWYDPHVLLELQSLYAKIDAMEIQPFFELAQMVFSSLLVKVSKQISDSRIDVTPRQVGRGSTSRIFGKKARELAEQLKVLARTIPPNTPEPLLLQADAREIPGQDESVDLVLTSPPYVGTYDYSSHQDRRFSWLQEDNTFAQDHEIGARSTADSPRRQWEEDESLYLSEIARVLVPGGRLFLMVGDGVLDGEPWWVERETLRTAEEVGFEVLAMASQERPHTNAETARIFGLRPRREHLISLQKVTEQAPARAPSRAPSQAPTRANSAPPDARRGRR